MKHKINNSIAELLQRERRKKKHFVLHHRTRTSNSAGRIARKYLCIPTLASTISLSTRGKNILLKVTKHFMTGNLDVLNS